MESCQQQIYNNNTNSTIKQVVEFQGVRNIYPTGETTTVYFTLPACYKPEANDFIGIYPVGWSQLSHFTCKRMVKPENVWTVELGGPVQYGKVEFDGDFLPKQHQQTTEQYYQFVYVKNGEYLRGASTPFMFTSPIDLLVGGEKKEQQEREIFGVQKQQHYYQQWEHQQQPRNLEQVERDMQKLQNGIFGLEQGLCGYKTVFPLIEETLVQQELKQQQPQQWTRDGKQQQQQPCGEWKWTNIFGGEKKPIQIQQELDQLLNEQQPRIQKQHLWKQGVEEVRQMLVEQARIEQAQRRIEQLIMLTQLKNYERHIECVQKHEQQIKEYLRAKQLTKVAEFEQKVYQVLKKQQREQGEYIQQQQQPEQYVRKYEQLLKEKIELDVQKRQAIMQKLRATIKECEHKLIEVQQDEQIHFARFCQAIKVTIGHGIQFEQEQEVKLEGDEHIKEKEQLRRQVAHFIAEQRKEQFNLIKSQKQLVCLINEISTRLQELEYEDLYTQLRVPRIQHTIVQLIGGKQQPQFYGQQLEQQQYEQSKYYTQVQQLEQQLSELKSQLRFNMQPKQQFTTGSWKQIAQKLREFEWTLRQEQPASRRLQAINQHIKYFEREQQNQTEILGQLRELEAELCEFYPQPHHPQQFIYQEEQFLKNQQYRKQLAELCQIVREKIGQLAQVYEQSPIECFVQSGNHSAWKKMMQLERKLVQLKGMMVEKQQYQHLQQRLRELEQQQVTLLPKHYQQKQQQIRAVRELLEQHQKACESSWELFQQHHHQQQQLQQWSEPMHYLFFTQPEKYIKHQQMYERLCQLVQDLECQQLEQQIKTQQGGSTFILPQFQRLIQQFQQRLTVQQQQQPELIGHKIEQVCQCLSQALIAETLKSKPNFGQQLREKIVDFELALLSLERELTQSRQGPWDQYVRQVSRQVRELKQQIQTIVDGWVLINCQEQEEEKKQQQHYKQQYLKPELYLDGGDLNNNTKIVFEPIVDTITPESLYEISSIKGLYGEQQQQIQHIQKQEEDFLPRSISNKVEQKLERLQQLVRYFKNQVEQKQEKDDESQDEEDQDDENDEDKCEEIYIPTTTTSLPYYVQQQKPKQQQQRLSVESLIGELETELTKLRLQKEFPCGEEKKRQQQQQPQQTRVVLTTLPLFDVEEQKQQSQSQQVQNKIQNLLTTVVPTIVKVQLQEKIRGEQQELKSNVFDQILGQCVKAQQQQHKEQF